MFDRPGAARGARVTPAVSRSTRGSTLSVSEAGIRAVIERYAAAWLGGDLATLVDCYHDDFALHYFGSNALSGDHVGKVASLATLAEFGRRTERNLLAIVATMAGRERGALVVREALGAGPDRIEVERVCWSTRCETDGSWSAGSTTPSRPRSTG